MQLLGARVDTAVSYGLKLVGGAQRIERCNGFDIERLGGQTATRSLLRALPHDRQDTLARHPHHIVALVLDATGDAESALANGCCRPAALIAANPDQSLTLTERVKPGERLCWAIRRPDTSETDMCNTLDRLDASRATRIPPACMLMFSCIGRGPYFYGGDDRDLALVRLRYPQLPVLGTYSTGQIAPSRCGEIRRNRLLQNSVVTAFISPANREPNVQSIT
ncbi:MAG: FIST C-terminal domain-containing protein [Propionivibrio sp.]